MQEAMTDIGIAGNVILAFEERHPEMGIALVVYNKSIYEMAVRILNEP